MTFLFGGFELDMDRLELRQNGQAIPIAPKAFSVLAYLAEHGDRMVSKAELLDAFWSANTSEAALQTTMSLVRKALQDKGKNPPLIKTYHGHGFRMLCPVQSGAPDTPQAKQAEPALTQLRERRLVAVLCARLSHEGDPDAASVSAFLDAARAQIAGDQGKLIRMMMNGFTVSFGLDPTFEDGAQRAAFRAFELTRIAAGMQGGVSVSFGIETGMVSREDAESEWAPPDDIERRASDLAGRAGRNEILLSDAARFQLGQEVATEQVADAYRLTSPPALISGIPARPQKRMTRFVGRAGEIAFLTAALARVPDGAGKALTLIGPAGIGKSRLVAEFLKAERATDIRVAKIQCLPRMHDRALAPIRQLCRDVLNEQRESLSGDRLGMALLNWLVDETSRPDDILEGISDQMRQQQCRELVLRLLREVCARAPLILILEDMHWSDAQSRVFMDSIIRSADSMRLMLVATTRPQGDGTPEGGVLHLDPLGHEDSLSLLRDMPEAADLSPPEAETLATRAAGNPFFLEELALVALRGGDLDSDLPDTVQAVIEVRIDALDLRARTLLYMISVIGPPAPLDVISHLAGLVPEQVEPDLARLVSQGFLLSEGRGFSFRHMLLNDTAYAMVAPSDRRDLHKRTATYYLQNDPEFEQLRPETLAWHFQEAGETAQAVAYWARASQAAVYRSDRHNAIVFSEQGLSLLSPDMADGAKQELTLQMCLGTTLMAVRGYGSPLVGTALERARELGEKVGSFKNQAGILSALFVHVWVAGRMTDAIEIARILLKMAGQVDSPILHLQANASMGEVLLHMSKLDEAKLHLHAAVRNVTDDAITTITTQNAAVTCTAFCAWIAGLQGDKEGLETFSASSRSLSEVINNPFARAIHFGLCSEAFKCAGDVQACYDSANQAVLLSREQDFPFWLGTGLVIRGWAIGQQGQFDDALADIDEGIAVFRQTSARIQLPNWYGLKADTLLGANRLQEAMEAGQRAMEYAAQNGDTWFMPRMHAIMARLSEMLGDDTAARAYQAQVEAAIKANHLADSFTEIRFPRPK